MSKNAKEKTKKDPDGFWMSDDRRVTQECKAVYPTLYKLQRAVLWVTCIIWAITLITPTLFEKYLTGYAAWSQTYELATLILSGVFLILYGFANYQWQEKMKRFRNKKKR